MTETIIPPELAEAVLKPCPFCGHAAEIERQGDRRQSTIYACTSCGCSLETGEEWGFGAQWNKRAALDERGGGEAEDHPNKHPVWIDRLRGCQHCGALGKTAQWVDGPRISDIRDLCRRCWPEPIIDSRDLINGNVSASGGAVSRETALEQSLRDLIYGMEPAEFDDDFGSERYGGSDPDAPRKAYWKRQEVVRALSVLNQEKMP